MLRCVIAIGFAAFAAVSVSAHDGLHAGRVIADVQAAQTDAATVFVTLEIEPLDGAVHLQGAFVHGAVVTLLSDDSAIAARTVQTRALAVAFEAPVPGLFTLILDFGIAGLGPVLVIPDP